MRGPRFSQPFIKHRRAGKSRLRLLFLYTALSRGIVLPGGTCCLHAVSYLRDGLFRFGGRTMLKRLSSSTLIVLSAILVLATQGHTLAGSSNVAAPRSDSLAGNCYLALSSEAPHFFEMDFGDNSDFNASLCTSPGRYSVGQEFLVFSLWNANCSVGDNPISFDGLSIASAVLLFQASGDSNARGLAFRTPCGVVP